MESEIFKGRKNNKESNRDVERLHKIDKTDRDPNSLQFQKVY